MFSISRPDPKKIDRFTTACENDRFSYRGIGGTQAVVPRGYDADRSRVLLGTGSDTFERARTAIKAWKMFDIGWASICDTSTPIAKGATVAILVSHFGIWSLNAARIVYTIDEEYRFGFAYGTLSAHAEEGEERLMVEFDRDKGEVWYEIYAFSRPGSILTWLGYPLARHYQRKFARDSKLAMQRAVEN